jgi:hypothetical protein
MRKSRLLRQPPPFRPKAPRQPPLAKAKRFHIRSCVQSILQSNNTPALLPKNSNLQIRRNDPFRPHPQHSNNRAMGNTNTWPQLRQFISPLPSTRSGIHDTSPLDNSTRNPQIPLSPSRYKISLLSCPARRRPPNDSWPLASVLDSTYDNPNSAKNVYSQAVQAHTWRTHCTIDTMMQHVSDYEGVDNKG